MAMHCPKCAGEIAEADVNVGANVAFCRGCDEAFALSALAKAALVEPEGGPAAMFQVPTEVVDISNPPKGCTYQDDGVEVTITASCRSETGWFFLFFSGFWNAITWSVGLAMIFSGDSGDWIAILFMIPFMLIGIGTAIPALVGLWGKVRVRVGREDGEVFLGLLGRGWRKQFRPAEVTAVVLEDSGTKINRVAVPHIVLKCLGDEVKFGTMLKEPKRNFVLGALKQVLGR
ncbi:MAG: hypothetical protein IT433_09260 [Phycisphaerales bacterium]|nr:hypothetical protein [Phycisphaerales bacterium]